MASFLSLRALLGSLRSICSINSLNKYLSKSVPNFSESYEEINSRILTYQLELEGGLSTGLLVQVTVNYELDLPNDSLTGTELH